MSGTLSIPFSFLNCTIKKNRKIRDWYMRLIQISHQYCQLNVLQISLPLASIMDLLTIKIIHHLI